MLLRARQQNKKRPDCWSQSHTALEGAAGVSGRLTVFFFFFSFQSLFSIKCKNSTIKCLNPARSLLYIYLVVYLLNMSHNVQSTGIVRCKQSIKAFHLVTCRYVLQERVSLKVKLLPKCNLGSFCECTRFKHSF